MRSYIGPAAGDGRKAVNGPLRQRLAAAAPLPGNAPSGSCRSRCRALASHSGKEQHVGSAFRRHVARLQGTHCRRPYCLVWASGQTGLRREALATRIGHLQRHTSQPVGVMTLGSLGARSVEITRRTCGFHTIANAYSDPRMRCRRRGTFSAEIRPDWTQLRGAPRQ